MMKNTENKGGTGKGWSNKMLLPALAGGLLMLGILPLRAVTASPASTWLSQSLIEKAWEKTLAGDEDAHPWPWMDSVPVARLIVPGRDKDFVVMRGASGAVLAFAPGWHEGTQMPGSPGITLISAHRDREFGFLRDMQSGEKLVLVDRHGARHLYTVVDMAVVQEPEIHVPVDEDRGTLLLSTSYPSSNWQAGGDMRFVVVAREGAGGSPSVRAADSLRTARASGPEGWFETVNN